MKKILVIAAILFFLPASLQASNRAISFEERPICEQSKGVWREFGDACANNCSDKFDEFRVCSKAVTYSCDCGINRCWHEQKCISNSTYKIIFDKEKEQSDKELAQRKKEREEKAKNDPQMRAYLYNLYPNKNPQNAQNQGAPNQQTQQDQIPSPPPIPIADNLQQPAIPMPVNQVPVVQAQGQNAQQRTPPPYYLMQQQQLKQEQDLKNQGTSNLTNSTAAQVNEQPAQMQPPLELPKIPMPQ